MPYWYHQQQHSKEDQMPIDCHHCSADREFVTIAGSMYRISDPICCEI